MNGEIGCVEEEDQVSGIIEIALLAYISNRAAKRIEFLEEKESNKEIKDKYKNSKNDFYQMKRDALVTLMTAIYVLENTSETYKDYFSYGERFDEEGESTFAIDIPYVGQVCVHFAEKQYDLWKKAIENTKKVLERKLELGQISKEKYEQISKKLENAKTAEICPEYGGELVEYDNALPIEYIGENVKKVREKIGKIKQDGRSVYKSPNDFTSDDINQARRMGLNDREIYYFFLKMGVPKYILEEIAYDIRKESVPGQNGNKYVNDDWNR